MKDSQLTREITCLFAEESLLSSDQFDSDRLIWTARLQGLETDL